MTKVVARVRYLVLVVGIVLGLLGVARAGAGSNVATDDKWAWSTNAGWINFNPTHGGVVVYSDHLEGYAWAENIGWIRLGSHTGGGAHTYGNTLATDYGVNRDGSGNLCGYAWSTNVGWIRFDPAHGGVTIDPVSGAFDGYAWAENAGWIRFGNPEARVNKWAWSNAGWINLNPRHGRVRVYSDHLEGYAWAENIGWFRLGSHVGGRRHHYDNTTKKNYGVNNDGSGNLSGYAWGMSVGWINFNPTHGGVTVDPASGSFKGYAWSENVGWIHFTRPDTYNVVAAPANLSLTESVTPLSAVHGLTR